MAFRRARHNHEQDPFTDLLFNALLGFTFMFLVAIMFLNPPAKTGIIDPKAEYIITTTWDEGRADDIDLWVRGPAGELVWFRNQEADLMHLDRDDRGTINDQLVVDGRAVTNPLNQEVVTIRGDAPGEYVVNLHYYNSQSTELVTADVEVVKVNPKLEVIYHGATKLERLGQEKTAVRFSITREGRVNNVNTLPASLVTVDP